MFHVTKLTKQGNSVGVRIPKKMLQEAGLNPGDEVVLRLSQGGIHISKAGQNYTRAMQLGREGAVRYRRALKRLAD